MSTAASHLRPIDVEQDIAPALEPIDPFPAPQQQAAVPVSDANATLPDNGANNVQRVVTESTEINGQQSEEPKLSMHPRLQPGEGEWKLKDIGLWPDARAGGSFRRNVRILIQASLRL